METTNDELKKVEEKSTNIEPKEFESARSAYALRRIGRIVLWFGIISAFLLLLAFANRNDPTTLIYALVIGFNCVLFWAFATGIADIVDNTKRLVERFEEKE